MELPGAVAHVDGTLGSFLVWEAIVVAGVGLSTVLLGVLWVLDRTRWRRGVRAVFVVLALVLAAAISPTLFSVTAKAIWNVGGDGTFSLGLVPTNYALRDFLPALLAAGSVGVVALRRAFRGEKIPSSQQVA